MNLRRFIEKNKTIQVFLWWLRSMSIVLHLSKPVGHAASSLRWIFFQLVLFLPTILGGVILTAWGLFKCKRINEKDKKLQFEYELTIIAIAKNEGSYLKEWIEYHRLLGVERIVLYDNESTDETKAVIAEYIKMGLIDYHFVSGKAQQVKVYSEAIKRYKYKTRYIGFLDIDEFVVVKNENKIVPCLNEIMSKNLSGGGVCIPWYNYGTSFYKTRPKGLVIENFTKRAPYGFIPLIKTFGNPRLMKCCVNPHVPVYLYGTCNIDERGMKNRLTKSVNPFTPQLIHINHYYTKSEEEYWEKINRGLADGYGKRKNAEEVFKIRNRNDIDDKSLLLYVKKMKNILGLI